MLDIGLAERRAGVEVTSGGVTLPSTTIAALHRRQRILTFLSWTRSSATAYLAGHCPHCTFMGGLVRRLQSRGSALRSGFVAQPKTLEEKNPKSRVATRAPVGETRRPRR